jgi:hypothetical protein
MAGMGLSGGFAAGVGADALEDILKRAFVAQTERRRAKQADRGLDLEAERNKQSAAIQQAQLESMAEARAATQKLQAQQGAERTAFMLPMGTKVSGPTRQTLIGGDLGDLTQQGEGDTLNSRNLSGALSMAEGPTAAPMAIRGQLRSMGNAGSGTFLGTAQQHAAELARQDTLAARTEAGLDRDEAKQARIAAADLAHKNRQEDLRLMASLRPPPQQQTITIQTVDAQGNPVTKVVPKTAGAEFATAPKPATENQTNLGIYASRLKQANPALDTITPSIRRMSPAAFEAQSFFDKPYLQSKEMQAYQQAARMFINSTLRRESGAAISPTEFAEARKQYLPIPGDTDQALKMKAAARADVMTQFEKGASGGRTGPSVDAGAKRVRYDMSGNPVKD